MPIPIPSYEPIPRRPIPASEAVVQPTGELMRLRHDQETSQSIITVIGGVLNLTARGVGYLEKESQRVKTAEADAELAENTSEAKREFNDKKVALDQTEPSDEYVQTHATQDTTSSRGTEPVTSGPTRRPWSLYQSYYSDQFQEHYTQILEDHKSKISDAQVRSKFEEWMADYAAKAYGDYLTAGLNRDAKRALARFNAAIADDIEQRDVNALRTHIEAAVAAQVYSPDAGNTMLEEKSAQIHEANLLDYARNLGDKGPVYMTAAGTADQWSVTPERAKVLSRKLMDEINLKRQAQEVADAEPRREAFLKAAELIKAGKITTEEELRAKTWTLPDGTTYTPKLYEEDYANLTKVMAGLANKAAEKREKYKSDVLNIVADAIQAVDVPSARHYLDSLYQQGFDKGDPDLVRAEEKLRRLTPGATGWDKDVSDIELRIIRGTATLADPDWFQQRYPTEKGQEKAEEFRRHIQEMLDRRKKGPEEDPQQTALYRDYFDRIFYADDSTAGRMDELRHLETWRRDNFPTKACDPSKSGIPDTEYDSWGRMIDSKMKDLREAGSKQRAPLLKAGEDRIRTFYDTLIKPKLGSDNRRVMAEVLKLMNDRDAMIENYKEKAKDSDDPDQEAIKLLSPLMSSEINRAFGPDYGKMPQVTAAGELGLPATTGAAMRELLLRGSQQATVQTAKAPEISRAQGRAQRTIDKYSNYRKLDGNKLFTQVNTQTHKWRAQLQDGSWVPIDPLEISYYNEALKVLGERR